MKRFVNLYDTIYSNGRPYKNLKVIYIKPFSNEKLISLDKLSICYDGDRVKFGLLKR